MSRSTKKPIIKDKGLRKSEYWGKIRANWNVLDKTFDYDFMKELSTMESRADEGDELSDEEYLAELRKEVYLEDIYPDMRTIVNKYDICDYIFCPEKSDEKYFNKAKRK